MTNPANLIPLLQELISARGPSGQEDEVRAICIRELETLCDKTWTDASGNVIGFLRGVSNEGPAIRVMAHMDELAMIVKRINEDGTLRVNPLGGQLRPGTGGDYGRPGDSTGRLVHRSAAYDG